MSQISLCSIIIISPKSEIKILETALRMQLVKIDRSLNWLVNKEEIVLVVTIFEQLTTTANLLEVEKKIARTIIIWRNQLRTRGQEIEGRLENPVRSSLNLNRALDNEIEEWFFQF
ncbi:hypothetical protein Xen7305DRAFT_00045540 [Xenococcus sp. PCC 7305]|uniref:hypothetical protein n=1 Tax=Xenococcus sp. PCC 7305 TaxID=102125 RepID=UPI0002AC3B4C|nr:hypothetical protein [Xenococcus sp. PCC 7305]ELS04818.1 hypothetical protein Xen7305DRAFT_00045540 [Xenococcus sp. PCC 7305]